VDGTNQYKNAINKENFINQMRIDISKSIPVDDSRLKFSSHFLEYDKIRIPIHYNYRFEERELLFIKFKIDPPDENCENCFNKNSAEDIFNDFVNLLDLKDSYFGYLDRLAVSDNHSYTRYIDKTFRLTSSCKHYFIYSFPYFIN